MNIKQAKEQLKLTVQAYLARDSYGNPEIPTIAQRPILLMGPPGIGKTAIAHQTAQECGIAIVAYTMTHHTRQSAIGLPSIQTGSFAGKEFRITEYTMSEIVASIYRCMEQTGLHSGILFLDEINCVSETLAPAMLQFLQCKTFGNHRIPENWIIVAAGNPPEYNRSVRDFDIVTLDRVRRIDIDADYTVWKEYAYLRRIHSAILAYLDIKRDHFYRIETTVDGKRFVTARGWEDLSLLLSVSEKLDLPVDESVIAQYLQHPAVAKDFANYLNLYRKYKVDYDVAAILQGEIRNTTVQKLLAAPFDERFSAISLLLDALFRSCAAANEADAFVTQLHKVLQGLIQQLNEGTSWQTCLDEVIASRSARLEQQKQTGQLDRAALHQAQNILHTLERYRTVLAEASVSDSDVAANQIRSQFQHQVQERKTAILTASEQLDYAFRFLEQVFGEGQELVIFLTELTMNHHSMKFISENGCEPYHQYNRLLLLGGRQAQIVKELNTME